MNDYWKLDEIVRICEVALSAPPRNCDNCRHAIDYWPMYMGRAVGLWATVGCDRDSPPNEKRYKLTHTCKLWEEQEEK